MSTYRLVRQTGSPFLYADFEVWDAALGAWVRRFKSTKKKTEAEAKPIAAQFALTARKIGEAAQSQRWSRGRGLEFVNELLSLAGLPTERPVPSWSDFSASWLAMKSKHLTEPSMKPCRRRVAIFTQWLGSRARNPLNTFEARDFEDLYEHLSSKLGLSARTANFTMKTLAEIFERARNEGYIATNFVKLVNLKPAVIGELVKEPFTPDEVIRLLDAAKTSRRHPEEWVTMIYLGICTGARMRDCSRLGLAHLHRVGKVWVLRFKPSKTYRLGKELEVPVVEPLLSHLLKLKGKGDRLLFCPHLAQKAELSMDFAEITKAAGIDQRAVVNAIVGRKRHSKTFHSLRHSLPTWLKAVGVDEDTRMKITGHSNAAVHRGYTHEEVAAIEAAMNRGLAGLRGA